MRRLAVVPALFLVAAARSPSGDETATTSTATSLPETESSTTTDYTPVSTGTVDDLGDDDFAQIAPVVAP